MGQLKAILAKEVRDQNANDKLKYEATGGGSKNKNVGARRIGNNSNKIHDFKAFIAQDESD